MQPNLKFVILDRVRLAKLVKQYGAENKTKIPKKPIGKVDNPTLLSDRELDRALAHYMDKVEQNHSY